MKYLLLIIFAIGILVRLTYFNQPAFAEDANLSYLITRHAHIYHDDISTIMLDNGYGKYINSPLFMHSISTLIQIYDSVDFLGFANIIFQMITIVCIWAITFILFDVYAAIIVTLLFSTSSLSFYQSTSIWAPYMMQCVLYISLMLLTYAYTKKNYYFLLGSICIFFIAFSIHKSAFILFPAILYAASNLLLKLKVKQKQIAQLIYIPLTIVILLHIQPIFYILSHQTSFHKIIPTLEISQSQSEFTNFFQPVKTLLTAFYPSSKRILLLTISLFMLMLASIYAARKNEYIRYILFALFSGLIIVSIITDDHVKLYRYLTPIYGLFCILLGASLRHIFRWRFFNPFFMSVILFGYVYIFSYNVSLFDKIYHLPQHISQIFKNTNPFIKQIINEVHAIQKEEWYPTVGFFQVTSYKEGARYKVGDTILLAPLEKELQYKFIQLDESPNLHFHQVTENKYMLLLCIFQNAHNNEEICTKAFLSENPTFTVGKNIYRGNEASIFISKKSL